MASFVFAATPDIEDIHFAESFASGGFFDGNRLDRFQIAFGNFVESHPADHAVEADTFHRLFGLHGICFRITNEDNIHVVWSLPAGPGAEASACATP